MRSETDVRNGIGNPARRIKFCWASRLNDLARREIRRIATHLGLNLNEAAINHIDSKTNLESSSQLCDSLTNRPAKDIQKVQNHIVDPATKLHHNHINGGTVGRWKYELSIDQVAYMTEFFAPWLRRLGYETEESLRDLLKAMTPMSNDSVSVATLPPDRPGSSGLATCRGRWTGAITKAVFHYIS
jgi:hypothetical protein